MKISRVLCSLGVVFGVILFATPVFAADIDQNKLACSEQSSEVIQEELPLPVCDLGIQKQVAVNGGAFNDADTVAAAVNANIGSTLTYKLIVNSFGTTLPYGVFYVKDVLPTQVTYVAHEATSGTYNTATNLWVFNDTATLPAVLTITATVAGSGTIDNVGGLEFFAYCNSECPTNDYIDDNPANNSDHSYVTVSTTPQVLGSSTTAPPATLAATGASLQLQNAAAVLLTGIATVVMFKKNSSKL